MIVSGIWWKRVDASLKALALAPLLSLLGGCGVEQLFLGRPPAQELPPLLPPAGPGTAQTEVGSGLSPLLTPQQVLTAVPFGRRDPFAPLPAPAAAAATGSSATGTAAAGGSSPSGTGAGGTSPGAAPAAVSSRAAGAPGGRAAATAVARLAPPDGFRLTGVIRSGGRAEALVSYGPLSGSLRPGDRGGRSTDLLPAGWALASIQFGGRTPLDPPSVLLQRGAQRVKVSL